MKKSKKLRNLLFISTIVVVLILAFFFLKKENLQAKGDDVESEELPDQFSNVEEAHFRKMPITYALDINTSFLRTANPVSNEDAYEIKRIKWALEIIENYTEGLVKFQEVSFDENPDIWIYGVPEPSCYEENETYSGKEGFAGPNITEGENTISNSFVVYCAATNVVLPSDGSDYLPGLTIEDIPLEYIGFSWAENACREYPIVELHELMHAFGFGHVYDDSSDLMYPIDLTIQVCQNNNINEQIFSCLKNIYSNGQQGSCDDVDTYPWEEDPTLNVEDFRWVNIPVNYSVSNCVDTQQRNLKKAEAILEGNLGFNILQPTNNVDDAQIKFECMNPLADVQLNYEVDYWTTGNYFPAAQPYYYFDEDNKIEGVKIILFGQDRNCGGIELHEFLHGLGIRDHLGYWMTGERWVCSPDGILDTESLDKLKSIYGL